MKKIFSLLLFLSAFVSQAQPPVSTPEIQFVGTTAFSTTNGRIRYNTACNCFVFRYGGANVTPPLVAAPGVGQNGQAVRWNNGTTSWEYYTPGTGTVTSVSGTANRITIGGTAADPTVDIASNYVGQNTITTLGTITTGVWTGTDIAYANIAQGSALSVLGVAGNSTADNASIAAGSDKQIMRREGTAIAFGSIDLAASGAVGSSILGVANGGTGSATQSWWGLNGTSTFGGNVTIAHGSNTLNHTYTGTGGAIPNSFTSTITAAGNNETDIAFDLNTTFNNGGFTGVIPVGLRVRSGRIGLNTATTDPAAALHLRGLSTTSSTTTLRIEDSGSNSLFRLLDDGFIRLGSNGSPPNIGPTANGTALSKSGDGLMLTTNITGTTIECTNNATSGDSWKIRVHGTNNPSSASTAIFRDIYSTTTFNFTNGGSTATAIGFDWNPTLTSVTTAYGIRIQPAAALNGFGTATPVSTLESARSFGAAIASTSTDITLDVTHYTVLVDASGANRTITLPAASGSTRRIYIVKKTDATANTVTIDGNGAETIDGATTQVISTQWAGFVIQSNGTSWFIIGTL